MKKINMIAVLVTIIALLGNGCATNNNSNDAAIEQAAIISAASLGTQVYLQKNPKSVAYFVGAEEVLNTIATGTNSVTLATVEAALAASGTTNVNPVVTVAITDALNLADAYINNSGTNNTSTQLQSLKSVSGWIATGLGQGVQLSTVSN